MKAIPPNAPLSRGKKWIHVFIDSNDAGNKQNSRSMTEFMIYMNMSLILL